jgi:hypothetical protein
MFTPSVIQACLDELKRDEPPQLSREQRKRLKLRTPAQPRHIKLSVKRQQPRGSLDGDDV